MMFRNDEHHVGTTSNTRLEVNPAYFVISLMDGSASGTGHCAADEERRREIRKEIAKIHDSVEDAEKITYEELSAKLRTSFEGVGNINQWRTDVMGLH